MLKEKELEQLVGLLGKIDNPQNGLPLPVFESLCRLVPFVACELIIMNDKNQILLTWREDEFWKGWHFPGGLMRYRESVDERVRKTALDEVGVGIESYEFLGFEDCHNSLRGPVMSLLFICHIKEDPKCGKFFNSMPADIIESHKVVWNRIIK